jgi:hypothetical protein
MIEDIVRWIVENVDASVVPADCGNGDALVYNLVHLARDGEDYRPFYYEKEQNREIARGFDIGGLRKNEACEMSP